jgi:membrane associated rhomboid family serine protease
MLGEKTAAAAPMALARAHVSLALIGAAVIGFVVPLLLGSAAATRRDAALERAADFYAEHPYLEAPLELMLDADDGPGNLAATALDPDAIAREQAELDAILAELDASEREALAHRYGLARGAVSTASLALHALLHASWLQLLWNLGLLASAGARLELRLGRARYGALLLASSAAGALLHLVAGGSAPLVGLSAATAGIAGAFVVRPGDVAPLRGALGARRAPRSARSPASAPACAAAALLGVGRSGSRRSRCSLASRSGRSRYSRCARRLGRERSARAGGASARSWQAAHRPRSIYCGTSRRRRRPRAAASARVARARRREALSRDCSRRSGPSGARRGRSLAQSRCGAPPPATTL